MSFYSYVVLGITITVQTLDGFSKVLCIKLLGGARVVVSFRNDVQVLLVRRDSSGWFSLFVPISYVVGVSCSSLSLFLALS